jgi:hypothetical protein
VGLRWWVGGFLGILIGVVLAAGGTYGILADLGLLSEESQRQLMAEFMANLQTGQLQLKIEPGELLQVVPGLFVVLLVLSLGFGVMFEKRVFRWFALPRERYVSQINLLEFRLPDALVWISLTALLIAFVDFGIKPLSIVGHNIVYVVTVLYFFQGLAVLEVFLQVMRAGFFVRFLTYFLIVGNIFFVVSMFGFVDFWLDFRRRLRVAEARAKKNETKSDE